MEEGDLKVLWDALDGKRIPEKSIAKMLEVAGHFNYPLFLRTDFNSGKHDFRRTCYVKSEKDVISHAVALFEDTIMKDIYLSAYVFREFIPLFSPFKAFNELPISKERRYFVDEGKVLCHHHYWVEDAISFTLGKEPRDNWKLKLQELNTESPEEIEVLSKMATTFAEKVEGSWSVDFAMTAKGDWILIDAAEALMSWHPSDCKIAFGSD